MYILLILIHNTIMYLCKIVWQIQWQYVIYTFNMGYLASISGVTVKKKESLYICKTYRTIHRLKKDVFTKCTGEVGLKWLPTDGSVRVWH